MTAQELVNIANKITNINTTYQLGGIGQQSNGIYLFDCVGLIKSILWGFNFNNERLGGAVYCSNGVPDIGANKMIETCNNISTDFNNIEVGEVVWMDGHIGIYVGNRQVVEATAAWEKKVVISDIGSNGERSRNGWRVYTWTKHGKLPYVTYEQPKVAQITSFNADVTSRSMTLNFETDLPVDWAKYQTDGLGFADLPVGSVVEGLTPNTTYNVAIQLRTQGSNEWVTSNTIQVTTLDEPITLKFNKGDKVKVNGPLFNKATENGIQGVNVTNYIDTISLIYDHYDSKHPYNIGDSHIGWVDESSLELYVEPTPTIPTPNEENNTTQNTQETTNTTTNNENSTNTQDNQENCSQVPNNANNGNNSLINTFAITFLLILALIWNFIKQFWILIIIVIILIIIIRFLFKEKTKK